jgi:hypothetical protein
MISWALLRPTPRRVSQFMVLKELFRFAQPLFSPILSDLLKKICQLLSGDDFIFFSQLRQELFIFQQEIK